MSLSQDTFSNILSFSSILLPQSQFETRMINSSTGQVLYIGKSITPSALTSDPVWYIQKLSYDSNGFLNYVQLPNNGVGFFYIWNDVTTYF